MVRGMQKEKRVLGKPMSHWEAQARSLVVDTLVRNWSMYESRPGRNVSVIHEIAAKQFLGLAQGISERDCQESIATMHRAQEIIGPAPRPSKKPRRSAGKRSRK